MSTPTRETVAALMPQLEDELAQLVAIPGVSEWDFPEHTRPALLEACVAAAAAFLTLVATPANLMVMEPGGYRFSDYWKLGLPLLVLFGLVAVLLVPAIWSL